MREVCVELYCRGCDEITTLDYGEDSDQCPRCGSYNVARTRFVECDCGDIVYLDGFTNECYKCGALYNGFGQQLAPPEEWDEEDRYACFGPQNY